MNTHAAMPAPGLYAITDGPRPDLIEAVDAALSGGVRMLQYRDKTRDTERRHREAVALKALCDRFDVPLIIDNDVELASLVGARGVHLSKDDVDIRVARAKLGADAIIGASCSDSPKRAEDAVRHGASYVSFGAFFPSVTKPLAGLSPLSVLEQTRALGVPRVAIGGITPDNGRSLVEAGADFLAAVSAVFAAKDIRAAARRFADLYTTQRDHA